MTSNPTPSSRLRIPISIKLISTTLALLLVALLPVIYQSTESFSTVSEKREIETNMNTAVAKASETDNVLQSLLEKSKTLALLFLRSKNQEAQDSIELLLAQDRDLFAVDIYRKIGAEFQLEKTFLKKEKLLEFGTDESQIDKARSLSPFSFDLVSQGQVEIRQISSGSELPLIGAAFPLARDELGQTDSIGVSYFQISKLQKIAARQGSREIFLLDSRGRLLAHPDEKKLLSGADLQQHPLVALALGESLPRGQLRYEDENQNAFQGAYSKTVLGPLIVSEVPENEILEPSLLMRRQSFIMMGFVISLAFFFVFLLALSLVNPIERLASLIREVSTGNFEISAQSQIKSHDEVGDLAGAFDEMVEGLKERDKVKNLFSKFHGSSVTQDLLSNEIGVGGTRKNVTVFFSDVRGFTAFSESRSPEEVVEMLNEYFAVMVSIINRNGGVVDKFIGDAIMAVWGAPHEGPDDTRNALKSCLEMRQALAELNEKRITRGDAPIMIGMGLHHGHAISGTIGSEERMEYTVIGDTVNMTSRIEASTKTFGTDLLVSEAVAESLKSEFWIELAGAVEAKGKSEPLQLFKVRGYLKDGQQLEVKTPYSEYEAEISEKIKTA